MQVVLVQPDIVWESQEANFAKVRGLLDAHLPMPGALVVLPEMFAVGFSMNVAAIHEDDKRPTEAFLVELARRYKVYMLGGLVTQAADGRGQNQAVVVTPEGKMLARYTKLHPFSLAGEADFYRPGDHIVTFPWHDFVVAPFICYDLRFPEVYRIAAARGAHLLVTIANFPAARARHWVSLLVARALENQAYVVGVNRCGNDPNVAYPGRSLVVDPMGELIADAGADEAVLSADVSLDTVTAYRARFPALTDIRKDFLSGDF